MVLLWPVLLLRDYGLREGGYLSYRCGGVCSSSLHTLTSASDLQRTGTWRNPAWRTHVDNAPRTVTHKLVLVVVGLPWSGKTTLMARAHQRQNGRISSVDIGDNMRTSVVCTPSDADVIVQSLDISRGLQRGHSLYHGADVVAVCFSLVRTLPNFREPDKEPERDNFKSLASPDVNSMGLHGDDYLVKAWVREVQYHAPNARVIVVGTKCDYGNVRRRLIEISTDDDTLQSRKLLRPVSFGVEMVRELNAYAYLEVSAQSGQNVEQLFPVVLEAFFGKEATSRQSKSKCITQ